MIESVKVIDSLLLHVNRLAEKFGTRELRLIGPRGGGSICNDLAWIDLAKSEHKLSWLGNSA